LQQKTTMQLRPHDALPPAAENPYTQESPNRCW
jgi:hypothetical protein